MNMFKSDEMSEVKGNLLANSMLNEPSKPNFSSSNAKNFQFHEVKLSCRYSGEKTGLLFKWLDELDEHYLILPEVHRDEIITHAALAHANGSAKQNLLNIVARMKRETECLNWTLIKQQFVDHFKWDQDFVDIRQEMFEDPHSFYIRSMSMFRHFSFLTEEARMKILTTKCNGKTQKYLRFAASEGIRLNNSLDWFEVVMKAKREYNRRSSCFRVFFKFGINVE